MKYLSLLLLAFCILFFGSNSHSDNFEAWDFKPINGSLEETIIWFDQAKAVHERLGGKVEYWQHDVMGNNVISYLIRFDTPESWASFKDKLATDEAWQTWINKNYKTFSSHLVESFSLGNVLNPNAKASAWDDLNIIGFSAWEVADDKVITDLLTSMQKSSEIDSEFNLSPMVYSSGLGPLYYLIGGKNWADLQSKIAKRNESKAWTEYWTAAGQDPAGDFVRQAFSVRIQ